MAIVKRRGDRFLLQYSADGNAYASIASTILTNDASYSTGLIEITDKGTARDRKYLPGAGVRSFDISVNGYFSTENESAKTDYVQTFVNAAVSTNEINLRIIDEAGNTWTGKFVLENFEQTGGVDSAHEFSCTIKSSGTITYAKA